MLFAELWMDLQSVIQREVSQKEKNKYCLLTHVGGIQKNGTDEPICKAERETQTQYGHQGGKGVGQMGTLGD